MSRMLALACALAAFALAAGSASAQQPTGTSQPAPTPPYGPPITLEQAKRVMAAAELEAAKNSWQVAIAILDSGGNMVMFHKLDNTQLASIGVSEGKANTALRFKRNPPPLAAGCSLSFCRPSLSDQFFQNTVSKRHQNIGDRTMRWGFRMAKQRTLGRRRFSGLLQLGYVGHQGAHSLPQERSARAAAGKCCLNGAAARNLYRV
jgi:hypothetical protein